MHIFCEDLSFSYGNALGISTPALKQFSCKFEYHEGENILGIVMPFGSGKSTLLKLIAGINAPEAGSVHFSDTVINKRIVYFPSEPVSPEWLTLNELLKLLKLDKSEKAKKLIELCGLDGYEDHMPAPGSHAFRYRIQLAAALIGGASLILFDDPFSKLKLNIKDHLLEDILAMASQLECKFLFATSDLGEAYNFSDGLYIATDKYLSQFNYMHTKGKSREALRTDTNEILQNLPQMLRI